METSTPQRLFGIAGASERTGLPSWRIYSEIAASRMPCKRVGRRIYFSEDDIDTYLQRIQQNRPEYPADRHHRHTRRPKRAAETGDRLLTRAGHNRQSYVQATRFR